MLKKAHLLFIFLVITSKIFALQTENFTIKLVALKQADHVFEEKDWQKLKIKNDIALYLEYSPVTNVKGEIFYRVFLDGLLVEPKYIDTYYVINKPNAGSHIVKIVGYFQSGLESQALLLPFQVEEAELGKNPVDDKTATFPDIFQNKKLTFALIGIVLLQLLIILFLAIRKKGSSGKSNAKAEIEELKYSYKRAKEELEKQREENENLRGRVIELDQKVKVLEKTNVHLLEQKEKLTESKTKLELLSTQKEELFASAIHDIKNPASAIRGYIELLNSYELNANEQQEIMASLVASSEDIVKLSQQMCTIIAKALPEPKLKFTSNDIQNVIETVYNQNVSYAKAKNVKLYNKSAAGLPLVKIDPEKIEEVIDNLVNNAIKYAPPETIVEVRSYVKDANKKLLVVEVKDTGVGLSEDDLKKSFQKGVTLSNKPTGLEQSSGLGLWLVKRIIEEHGGKVWVESKLGVGSTFAFELPIE